MTRTGEAAIAWARGQHDSGTTRWLGLCLAFTHDCFDVGAKYPGAIQAWQGGEQHPTSVAANIPKAVPVYWGGGTWGHVALSTGGGYCWTSDFYVRGGISLAKIDDISRGWNKTLLGWTEDINGVTVWKPAPPATPSKTLTVSLAAVVASAKTDPDAAQGHRIPAHWYSAIRVERMLAREQLLDWRYVDGSFGTASVAAYKRFQQAQGYSGADADGIPGATTLKALCGKYGMRLAA